MDGEKLRDGIFALRTRRFGSVAECMVKRLLKCSLARSLFHDLYDDALHHRIEVKFSVVQKKAERTVTEQTVVRCVEEATAEHVAAEDECRIVAAVVAHLEVLPGEEDRVGLVGRLDLLVDRRHLFERRDQRLVGLRRVPRAEELVRRFLNVGRVDRPDDGENAVVGAVELIVERPRLGQRGLLQLGNLLLAFPKLKPSDFRPWIEPNEAARQQMSPDEFAASQAELWRKGLAKWDEGPTRIQKFVDAREGMSERGGSAPRIHLCKSMLERAE